MKSSYFLLFTILLLACNRSMVPSTTPVTNQLTTDSRNNPMLLGHCTIAALRQPAFASWFDSGYAAHQPAEVEVASLRQHLQDVDIEIFLGTWCGDSKREVPRLLKTLQQAGFDSLHVRLIMTGREGTTYKQSPQREEKGKHIFRVPTAIVYQHNKEKGRVIEYPITSWAADLTAILTNSAYTPHYNGGNSWMKTVKNKDYSQAALQQLATTFKPLVAKAAELNGVGYILRNDGQAKAALQTFLLNTLLFPNESNSWDSLAETYALLGDTANAITNYQKVLALKPNDANALEQLKKLEKK